MELLVECPPNQDHRKVILLSVILGFKWLLNVFHPGMFLMHKRCFSPFKICVMGNMKEIPPGKDKELVKMLKSRFESHMHRHKDMVWDDIQARIEKFPEKLRTLYEMEITGGEPDVIEYNKATGRYIFYDCSAESPRGRRSVCYDQEALESRKKFKPRHSASGMAEEMGISLLNEEQYAQLQLIGEFDTKTSSWIETPQSIRAQGGALFGDRRFGRVFTYHNGAESYYAARGFRGSLKV